jgi:hypothetical protein
MSPGRPTTMVPPSVGVPAWLGVSLDGALDGALDWPAGWLGAAADGAVVAVEPPHAVTAIAATASKAPIRVRDIWTPPPAGIGDRSPDGRPGNR